MDGKDPGMLNSVPRYSLIFHVHVALFVVIFKIIIQIVTTKLHIFSLIVTKHILPIFLMKILKS